MDFNIKEFIALKFNTIVYENGEALFKIRNIVKLREGTLSVLIPV